MKELTAARPTPTPRKWEHATAPVMPIRTQSMPISAETNKGRAPRSRPCFNCGLEGHLMKACTYPRHWKRSQETRGQRHPLVATMTSTRESLIRTYKQRVEGLRKDLLEAEQAKAAGKTAATMHHAQCCSSGPRPRTKVGAYSICRADGEWGSWSSPHRHWITSYHNLPGLCHAGTCQGRKEGRKDRHLMERGDTEQVCTTRGQSQELSGSATEHDCTDLIVPHSRPVQHKCYLPGSEGGPK